MEKSWFDAFFQGWKVFVWKSRLERDPQVMCKNMLVAQEPGTQSVQPALVCDGQNFCKNRCK